MDMTAKFLDTNIEPANVHVGVSLPLGTASPAENRDAHTPDTPLQRLADNAMSGEEVIAIRFG